MQAITSHRQQRFVLPLFFLLFCLILPGQLRAEIDDSSLFMEAFTSFQGKNYLRSIEKLHQLGQLYPDSPLRDVSLLMLARAQQRAGDNAAAGLTITQFSKEFGSGPLADSAEAELLSLGKRHQAGEKMPQNKQYHAAAIKIHNERLAVERAAALKIEQERLAQERAQRELIAREKAEADRRERERLAAIKAARDALRFEIEPSGDPSVLEVGIASFVPFWLVNQGKDAEEFSLEALLPPGVDGIITRNSDRAQPVQKITIQPRQRAELQISFKMPSDRVDGSRTTATVKATSTKYNDIVKTREITATAAAPLLRAVSRLQQKAPSPGDTVSYKVTLLNVGSKPAKDVDMRITLPQQVKLVDAGGNGCWVENEQLAACRVDVLQQGQLTERNLKVVVRNATTEKPVKGAVEVVQTVLQIKESFPGAVFQVKKP